MFQDHLPDHQLNALEQLLTKMGPPKPQRKQPVQAVCSSRLSSNNYSVPIYCSLGSLARTVTPDSLDTITANGSNRVLLETSFTDLRPSEDLNCSSSYSHSRCKSKSNSIRPSLLSALKYHGKTDVLRDHGHVLRSSTAPLATPEELSETSSIRSKSSLSQPGVEEERVKVAGESVMKTLGTQIERSMSRESLDRGLVMKREDEKAKMEEGCQRNEEEESCDCLESFARSEISLQELMDAFSSGKTSPSSSLRDTTKHVTFDPYSSTSTIPSSILSSSSFSHSRSSFHNPQTVIEFEGRGCKKLTR